MEYDFKYQYKKNSEMKVADFLSRNPIGTDSYETDDPNNLYILSSYSWNEALCAASNNFLDQLGDKSPLDVINENPRDFAKFQREDKALIPFFDYLENGAFPKDTKGFSYFRNLIPYLRLEDGILWLKRQNNYVVLLPQKLKSQALSVAHDSGFGGHRDAFRTQGKLLLSYWWPKMFEDTKNYIRRCHECQLKNLPHAIKDITAPLTPLNIPFKFNDRVSLDLMGPLFSDNGYRYILVITDVFSKWVELVPLENKEATTVAKAFFETWICRYSIPKVMLSDGGKEFCNQILNELNKELKIRHIKTSPYHPQTNASSERINRTLISYLRSYLTNKKETLEWTKWLPVAQLSYNTQVHSSTKFSPYFLVHFHDPTMPQLHQQREYMNYSDSWTSEALLRLNHAWKASRENLVKARAQQKAYYDQRTAERNFTVGDLVLIRNFRKVIGGNNKFLPVWTGPYVIMKVISSTNVILKLTPHSKERNVHINNIKHYFHDEQGPSYFESTSESDENRQQPDTGDDPDVESEAFVTPDESPVKPKGPKPEPESPESSESPEYPEPPPGTPESPEVTELPETPTGQTGIKKNNKDLFPGLLESKLGDLFQRGPRRTIEHQYQPVTQPKTEPPIRTTTTTTSSSRPTGARRKEITKTSTQTQTSPDTAEPIPEKRSLRSAGPVADIKLPERPPEYRKYKKHSTHKRGTSL
jgi:transposase InsO family protein